MEKAGSRKISGFMIYNRTISKGAFFNSAPRLPSRTTNYLNVLGSSIN